jgi:hypothetical protein
MANANTKGGSELSQFSFNRTKLQSMANVELAAFKQRTQ